MLKTRIVKTYSRKHEHGRSSHMQARSPSQPPNDTSCESIVDVSTPSLSSRTDPVCKASRSPSKCFLRDGSTKAAKHHLRYDGNDSKRSRQGRDGFTSTETRIATAAAAAGLSPLIAAKRHKSFRKTPRLVDRAGRIAEYKALDLASGTLPETLFLQRGLSRVEVRREDQTEMIPVPCGERRTADIVRGDSLPVHGDGIKASDLDEHFSGRSAYSPPEEPTTSNPQSKLQSFQQRSCDDSAFFGLTQDLFSPFLAAGSLLQDDFDPTAKTITPSFSSRVKGDAQTQCHKQERAYKHDSHPSLLVHPPSPLSASSSLHFLPAFSSKASCSPGPVSEDALLGPTYAQQHWGTACHYQCPPSKQPPPARHVAVPIARHPTVLTSTPISTATHAVITTTAVDTTATSAERRRKQKSTHEITVHDSCFLLESPRIEVPRSPASTASEHGLFLAWRASIRRSSRSRSSTAATRPRVDCVSSHEKRDLVC